MRAPRVLAAIGLVALPLAFAPPALRTRTSVLNAQDGDDDDDSKESPEAKAAREALVRKAKKARKALKLAGQLEVTKLQIDMMCAQFDKNRSLPPGFTRKFRELVKPKDLFDISVRAYAANLEEADLDDLIAFYETPSGKKLGDAQPRIQTDISKAAEKWGMEMGMKVVIALRGEQKQPDAPEDAPKPEKKAQPGDE